MKCCQSHCDSNKATVQIGWLFYCINCAPIVACNRARIIREYRTPAIPPEPWMSRSARKAMNQQ